MFEPFVGIVVPCYNAAATIARTLKSILLSQYVNYEVILVNDGSTDRTPDILYEHASRDKRFVVIDQENGGVSSARNNGVAAASADYIAFLDADEIFFSDSLSGRMKAFVQEEDQEMIGVFCPSIMLGENLEILLQEPLFNHPISQNRLYLSSLIEPDFIPSSVIMKKSKFTSAGGFDESLSPAEDFEFWHRVMRQGGYFKKVDDCLVGWVQHPASAAHGNILKHHQQYRKALAKINGPADGQCVAEFRQGLGETVHCRSLSQKAFASSLKAAIVGQCSAADEISQDISRIFLERTCAEDLVGVIKFCAMRALCRSEKEWPEKIWPQIKENVLHFLLGLSKRYDHSCLVLASVINHLEKLAIQEASKEAANGMHLSPDSYDHDSIELLSVSLIDKHPDIADMILRKSTELEVGLGWHYLLDLIWIIKSIRELPKGSVVLDAGAGNGLLQFILSDMGYRVISADFSERIIPQGCLARYTILQSDSGKHYENEYIRHLNAEFQTRHHSREEMTQSGILLREQIEQCRQGAIIYYRSDICAMDQVEDASIDCVVSVSALEHNSQENISVAVRELERVLKPGGPMLITVSATDGEDWYHEQSKGWCLSETTLSQLFSLKHPQTNFNQYSEYFADLKSCSFLEQRLDPGYFRSGNNGMPWGIWAPQYQPVGIRKLHAVPAAGSTVIMEAPAPVSTQLHHPPQPNSQPMTALIDTTDGCNLRCSFCSRNNEKIRMMRVDEFELILARISPFINTLQLSCAWEYSIARNAHEIVRTLGRYNIESTSIYSNGQILPEMLAESIIEAGITNLVFSIGEAKQKTYEQIRSGGRFDRIIRNIELAHNMKKQAGSVKPNLCANLTVINSNIVELPDFVTLAHRLGISEIRGRHLILNEGMEMDAEVIRDAAYANGIIETARNLAEGYGMTFHIPRYPAADGDKNCRAPWSQLYIASNGDVAACPRIHKYSKIGNLLDQEMHTLLSSPVLADLQRQMHSRSFSNPVCGICTQNKETELYINQGF